MRTVRLITCEDSFQAHLILGSLKNEGIAGILHNENTSNVMRGYGSNIAGVDIFVYEDEYDKAVTVLEQNQIIPEQLKYCPHCHSDNIQFVLKKKKRIRAVFSTLLSMLTASPPGMEHWEYVCKNCGTHFDKPTAKK